MSQYVSFSKCLNEGINILFLFCNQFISNLLNESKNVLLLNSCNVQNSIVKNLTTLFVCDFGEFLRNDFIIYVVHRYCNNFYCTF